jgi:phosphoribosylpyrophosphate synthetase
MSTINNIEEHNLDEEYYEFQDSISGELGKVKGIVKQSKTNIKITETDPDWIAGKERGDKEAADRFAEKFWTNELTEKLSKRIEKSDKLLFLSVPSSSKNNVHPISLIEKLSTEFDGEYLIGETFFDVLHERQSKQIRPFERVFHPRLYEPVNSEDLTKLLTGKDVIIADDIFTTGGSAAQQHH